jgi:hypothetical protein
MWTNPELELFFEIAQPNTKGLFPLERFNATEFSQAMDIEEGFSPIKRAATMSNACENRAAFRFPRRKTL